MDDILLAGKNELQLKEAYRALEKTLRSWRLCIAPEKVQMAQVVEYLGAKVTPQSVYPQKLEIRKDNLKTLNDYQRLLGDINWIRSYLKLANYELKPLYDVLKGDSALDSPRYMTKEAHQALQLVEDRLQQAYLQCIQEDQELLLCILPTMRQPTGVLWQQGPLLWIHPRVSPGKSIEHYPTTVAQLAQLGLQQTLQFFGRSPETIVTPYTAAQVLVLCTTIDDWAILRCSFPGKLDNHYPKHPLMTFFKEHPIVFPKVTATTPLPDAINIFTDGSKNEVGAYLVLGQPVVQRQFAPGTPQVTELQIVLEVFTTFSCAFNLISDSIYVINALKILEVAGPIKPSSTEIGRAHV